MEIDNPHAFLQLKFSSKVDWKRYDIVYIIIVQAYEKNLGLDEIHIYTVEYHFLLKKN